LKENVKREIVQSREKEAKEAEEAEEAKEEAEEEGEEEEEEEEDGLMKGEGRESRTGRIVSAGWLPAGARIEGTSRGGKKETVGGWRMSEDERCRGRKGGLAVVEGTKRGCGRRSAEAEEEGEKKKAKDKEIATREERKRKGTKETVGREGGKTLHEGLEM